MNELIGIIGYGFVGKAVEAGFKIPAIISDPKHNDITIKQLCESNPLAVFVCVPTPSDGSDFAILRGVLDEIEQTDYQGLVVVKSTVLPSVLEGRKVLFNPEFLSRLTAYQDFIRPPYLIIGGDRGYELLEIYQEHSYVEGDAYITDVATACMLKYTANAFYATKVAFMNEMYDVCQKVGADYNRMVDILSTNPWMGSHHFQVPGPDGQRGFGGPCLPKDTQAIADTFDVPLLHSVLVVNKRHRDGAD